MMLIPSLILCYLFSGDLGPDIVDMGLVTPGGKEISLSFGGVGGEVLFYALASFLPGFTSMCTDDPVREGGDILAAMVSINSG